MDVKSLILKSKLIDLVYVRLFSFNLNVYFNLCNKKYFNSKFELLILPCILLYGLVSVLQIDLSFSLLYYHFV
ncbi:hypothetical protein HanIR_Chr12g0602831 [Helianthus annuus]|nr:hypothetical protein HanIR_Chr12g0602831 [Helianthus annuus]